MVRENSVFELSLRVPLKLLRKQQEIWNFCVLLAPSTPVILRFCVELTVSLTRFKVNFSANLSLMNEKIHVLMSPISKWIRHNINYLLYHVLTYNRKMYQVSNYTRLSRKKRMNRKIVILALLSCMYEHNFSRWIECNLIFKNRK